MGLLRNGALERHWGLEEALLVRHELSFPLPSPQSLRNLSVRSQDVAGSSFSPARDMLVRRIKEIEYMMFLVSFRILTYHHRGFGLHEIRDALEVTTKVC